MKGGRKKGGRVQGRQREKNEGREGLCWEQVRQGRSNERRKEGVKADQKLLTASAC